MSRIAPFGQLIRAPATPTAISNVLMGYLVANGSWSPSQPLIAVLISSVAFYSAGMILNDVADIDEDRRLRPERPLPSGRIGLRVAQRLGWSLLTTGLIAACFASVVANSGVMGAPRWRPIAIATVLATAVVGYDFGIKRTWAGPLLMGACRSLNVLLGMSIGPLDSGWLGFSTSHWSIALGIGTYVGGVSLLARRESEHPRRAAMVVAGTIMAVALAWLAMLRHWVDPSGIRPQESVSTRVVWLFAVTSLPIWLRIATAVAQPTPPAIQRAVVTSLFSLILIDAILCFASLPDSPGYSLAVAGLLVPCLLFSRWAKAT